LAEPAIVGRNDDVSRKHHFDADRKDNPRNRGDSGLPTLVRQAEWIEISDLRALAATIKARWICEQAHQQLKEERALSLCDKGRRVLSGCKVHVRV